MLANLSVWLNPAALRSLRFPPVLAAVKSLSHLPGPLKRATSRVVYALGEKTAAPGVNLARKRHGLRPQDTPLRDMESDLGSVAFFPDWLAPNLKDELPNLCFAGFPLSAPTGELCCKATRFLDQGAPPVVVTMGSAMRFAQSELELLTESLLRLGQRVVLLCPNEQTLELPEHPGLFRARHLHFAQLFPRARMVVHHGGIGTCGHSLAAGRPQAIVPFALDQPDNATRLERLHVAKNLRRRELSAATIADALSTLLQPSVLQHCQDLSTRLKAQGLAVISACEHLENLVARERGEECPR